MFPFASLDRLTSISTHVTSFSTITQTNVRHGGNPFISFASAESIIDGEVDRSHLVVVTGQQILKGHAKSEHARTLLSNKYDIDKENQNTNDTSTLHALSSAIGTPRTRQTSTRKTNTRRNGGNKNQETSAGSQSSGTRARKGDRKKARNADREKKVVEGKKNRRKKQGATNRNNRLEGEKKPQQMNSSTSTEQNEQQQKTIEDLVENSVISFSGEPKADKTTIDVTLSGGGSSAAENFMTKFNQSWNTNNSGKPGYSGQEYNRYKTKRTKTAGNAGWNHPGVYGTTSTSWGSAGGAAKALKDSAGSWNGDVLLDDEWNCPCTYIDPPSWGGGGWSGSTWSGSTWGGSAWGGSTWGTSAWGTSTVASSGKAGKSTPIPQHAQRIKVCTCMPTYFPTYMPTYMPTT